MRGPGHVATAVLRCKRQNCYRACVEIGWKRWYPHFPPKRQAREFVRQMLNAHTTKGN